jgi:hypothetical protein
VSEAEPAALPAVPGRACGTCSLCCKVMEIGALDKGAGQWCSHVAKGKGCAIYSDRPAECRRFGCGWLHWPKAGEHWFPARSKMVIVAQDRTRLAVHVDPATPNAWKARPFYDDLKLWARNPQVFGFRQVLVVNGRHMIAVLPDREVDLGHVSEDEIVLSGQTTGGGWTALKVSADDPQLATIRQGGNYEIGGAAQQPDHGGAAEA